MNANGRFRKTRLMKLAAGLLIAVLVVATGWAAEKVYQKIMKKSYYVELEKGDPQPSVKLPDGPDGPDFMVTGSSVGTTIPDDAPPGSTEKAKRHHEMMKQLIAENKYEFVKNFESPPGGETQYIYRFTFSDGEHLNMNFSMRLENVTSWDDYQQKSKEQRRQRDDKISKAIAAGKFRLLDVEPLSIHICSERESDQQIRVQHIRLHNGKEIASVIRKPEGPAEYQTSWEDHLQAIRRGDRALLDLHIIKNFTYEITFDDGSTTILSFGGDEPLKKPQG